MGEGNFGMEAFVVVIAVISQGIYYTPILLQDGLERRGFKESGFLDEVVEVVKTANLEFISYL